MSRVDDYEALIWHQIKSPGYRAALAAQVEKDVRAIDSRITGLVNVGLEEEEGCYYPFFDQVVINGQRKGCYEIKVDNFNAIHDAIGKTLASYIPASAWGWGEDSVLNDFFLYDESAKGQQPPQGWSRK